ncbi:hypothetical protein AN958_11125 [Leucoagaricus sp. SymC.cos]|nr:hypothetical protein AN958_11125 [Leucoagaricus sp. SymC.cos]
MWPDANDSEERERCEIRLEDLLDNYWASMMARGSQSHEFTKELSSAEEIINRIICIHREGRADEHIVQIQKEMVYDLKKIPNTQAGRHLHGVMEELVERQNRILAQLRRELAECSFQDQKIVDELFEELKNLRKQREKATKDLHELQAPWVLAKLRAWFGVFL